MKNNILTRCLHVVAGVSLLTCQAYAREEHATTEVPSTETPSLRIDQDVSDKIYLKSKVSSSVNEASKTPIFSLESSARIFFPGHFELKNEYFIVPYGENTSSIGGVMIGPHVPFFSLGTTEVTAFTQLGYAYSQGIYDVKSESGLTVKDAVELQWIPLQAGFELNSRPLTRQQILLGASSAAGVDWYTQSGQLDGMNQTFWVPRTEFGVHVTLFSQGRAAKVGFEGIRISALAYRSLASEQVNRGTAADIGLRYGF
jgi:hypothetical protein